MSEVEWAVCPNINLCKSSKHSTVCRQYEKDLDVLAPMLSGNERAILSKLSLETPSSTS